MKAVVVYESLYGNTHAVAEAVAEGLRERAEVDVSPVEDSSSGVVEDADLLVVGGPTHVHGMSSRQRARARSTLRSNSISRLPMSVGRRCASGSTPSVTRGVSPRRPSIRACRRRSS